MKVSPLWCRIIGFTQLDFWSRSPISNNQSCEEATHLFKLIISWLHTLVFCLRSISEIFFFSSQSFAPNWLTRKGWTPMAPRGNSQLARYKCKVQPTEAEEELDAVADLSCTPFPQWPLLVLQKPPIQPKAKPLTGHLQLLMCNCYSLD